jgi:hypothetical protein
VTGREVEYEMEERERGRERTQSVCLVSAERTLESTLPSKMVVLEPSPYSSLEKAKGRGLTVEPHLVQSRSE